MPTQVAPGVHRLGNEYVNFYLIEDGNRLTLVDGGLPGFRDRFDAFLRSRGRRASDIDAVILTHAHPDHTGVAEYVRSAAAARVYVHEADAEMARNGARAPLTLSMLALLRHRSAIRYFAMGARNGAAKPTKIADVTTFTEGDLDVPGRPRVIPTPGHSPGHVPFHLPDRGVLIAGDALCTLSPANGQRGPRFLPSVLASNAQQMLISLDAIERIDASVLLVGHGEPWTEGVNVAVERTREVGLT